VLIFKQMLELASSLKVHPWPKDFDLARQHDVEREVEQSRGKVVPLLE